MSLLFTDGFESLDVFDISRKWGSFSSIQSTSCSQCAIVSGVDPLSGKPLARKGGRSLYLPKPNMSPWDYYSHNFVRGIEKSRTVYFGFALRLVGSCFVRISLGTGRGAPNVPTRVPGYEDINYSGRENVYSLRQPVVSSKTIGGPWREPGLVSPYVVTTESVRKNGLIASLSLTFNKTNISCRVDFPEVDSIPFQVGTVEANSDLYNGDYHYYQFGLTLLGNNPVAGNSSWVDFRMGNRLDKRWFQQCQTCVPDSPQSFFINSVGLSVIPTGAGAWLDDVYIANDDGDVNNDFLGSIYVRNTYVSTQGSRNSGVPQNTPTGNRGDAVSARFVTAGNKPYMLGPVGSGHEALVSGTDLNAISESGDQPFDSSLTLENDGDDQSFLFAPIHYFGATPNVKACVLHAACLRKYADLSYPYLDAYFRYGSESEVFSRPNPRPIAGFHPVRLPYFDSLANWTEYSPTRYPEVCCFVIENKDGPESRLFNAERLNMSEFGFVLSSRVPNFIEYTPLLVRKSLYLDIVVSDSIRLDPYCSRYIEEMLVSSFSVSSLSIRDWGGSVDESLIFFDGSLQALGYQHLITDPLRVDDAYPEVSQNVSSTLPLSDSVVLSYHHFVGDSVGVADTSYGVWVEEFREIVVSVSETFNGIAVLAASDLSVAESDLFDGHLDVSEDVSLLSSYVWDGHESADEYLGLHSFAQDALIELVNSLIEYSEDHFDGYWVEQFDIGFNLSDSILTQHWRYEWFMGILINAWQISPVEDPGMDGYHVGDLDPEIFGDA